MFWSKDFDVASLLGDWVPLVPPSRLPGRLPRRRSDDWGNLVRGPGDKDWALRWFDGFGWRWDGLASASQWSAITYDDVRAIYCPAVKP